MKNNLKQKGFIVPVLLGIIAILIIGGGMYIYKAKKVDAPAVVNENEKVGPDNSQEVAFVIDERIIGNKEDLVSFSVKSGDVVSGILKLSGTVKNGYFFEGNIEVHLLDSNQKIIRSGFGTSTTSWMTAGPVSFTSSIDTLGLKGDGYIMLRQDDPSGGEGGPAKKILIPVVFDNLKQDTMSIKLFFPNRIFNPESFDCSLVYDVIRLIPYTKSVAAATLNEFIKGPTKEEEAKGYFGVMPSDTKVNSIKIVNGILSIDFSKEAEAGGGSCGQSAKVSSLNKTMMQFPTVKNLKISIEGNGNPEQIFQP